MCSAVIIALVCLNDPCIWDSHEARWPNKIDTVYLPFRDILRWYLLRDTCTCFYISDSRRTLLLDGVRYFRCLRRPNVRVSLRACNGWRPGHRPHRNLIRSTRDNSSTLHNVVSIKDFIKYEHLCLCRLSFSWHNLPLLKYMNLAAMLVRCLFKAKNRFQFEVHF